MARYMDYKEFEKLKRFLTGLSIEALDLLPSMTKQERRVRKFKYAIK